MTSAPLTTPMSSKAALTTAATVLMLVVSVTDGLGAQRIEGVLPDYTSPVPASTERSARCWWS